MTAAAPRTLDAPHFTLLDQIVRRLSDRPHVDDLTRLAVTVLTSAADPECADRLAVRPGEPPVLVERLAVWALRRAPDHAVSQAARILEDGAGATTTTSVRVPASEPATGRHHRPLRAAG